MNGPIQTKALYEEVADRIRQLIYHGELEPGEWIDEKALCERLGISRTPLREALKVLASEGLLVLQPRRGCQVRTLSREELEELFPVMAVLEGLCAREAVEKCSAADSRAWTPCTKGSRRRPRRAISTPIMNRIACSTARSTSSRAIAGCSAWWPTCARSCAWRATGS
jgi:DNA-binding GntR family transcriptional regulator